MNERVSALLIYERLGAFGDVQRMLESRAIEVQIARSCGDALLRLWSEQPPHLVFTETQLLDGMWADVLSMTRKSPLPVNVIVVSRLADVNLYVQVLERGAFDCIIPPFEVFELDHVIRCATDNVMAQRVRQRTGVTASTAAAVQKSVLQDEKLPVDDDLQAAPTL